MATSITNTSVTTDSITAPTVNANTIDPTQGYLSIAQQNAAGEGGEILLAGSNGNANAVIDNNNGAIRILQGANTRINIDTNGVVRMQNQPSFCARLNSNPAMDIAVVPFETVLHNVGNHYSNSTYRFTAPVTGRYYLSYSVRVNHGTSGHIIHPVFFINGNSDTTSRTIYKNDTSAQYMPATFSYVRQLNANDYVTVNMASSSGGGNMQNAQCSFTGHLLG